MQTIQDPEYNRLIERPIVPEKPIKLPDLTIHQSNEDKKLSEEQIEKQFQQEIDNIFKNGKFSTKKDVNPYAPTPMDLTGLEKYKGLGVTPQFIEADNKEQFAETTKSGTFEKISPVVIILLILVVFVRFLFKLADVSKQSEETNPQPINPESKGFESGFIRKYRRGLELQNITDALDNISSKISNKPFFEQIYSEEKAKEELFQLTYQYVTTVVDKVKANPELMNEIACLELNNNEPIQIKDAVEALFGLLELRANYTGLTTEFRSIINKGSFFQLQKENILTAPKSSLNPIRQFSAGISAGVDFHKVTKAVNAIFFRLQRFDDFTDNQTNIYKIKEELFYLGYLYLRGIEDKVINSLLALNYEEIKVESLGNQTMTVKRAVDNLMFELFSISKEYGLYDEIIVFLKRGNNFREFENTLTPSLRNSFK